MCLTISTAMKDSYAVSIALFNAEFLVLIITFVV